MANNPMRDKMRTMWRGLDGLQSLIEGENLYTAKLFVLTTLGYLGQKDTDFNNFRKLGLISRDVCRLMAAIQGLCMGDDYHGWGLYLKDELLEWIRDESDSLPAPQVFAHYKIAYDKTNRAGRMYLLKLDIDDTKHLLPELRWWNWMDGINNRMLVAVGREPSE